MGKIVTVSLSALFDYYAKQEDKASDTVYTALGYKIVRTIDKREDGTNEYYDLCGQNMYLCFDGEEVEIIGEEEDKVILKRTDFDDSFCLTKDEFKICTFN